MELRPPLRPRPGPSGLVPPGRGRRLDRLGRRDRVLVAPACPEGQEAVLAPVQYATHGRPAIELLLQDICQGMKPEADPELRVWETPGTCLAPVTVGVLRPVIVLSPAMFHGLAPNRLREALVHECAHVRRNSIETGPERSCVVCGSRSAWHPVATASARTGRCRVSGHLP